MFSVGVVLVTCLFFVWSSHPVHGVLSLVVLGLGFAAGLLGSGLEFPALIVVLVYVGAVTVLFVFVVMMVNLRATPGSYVTGEAAVVWVALAAAGVTAPVGSPPPVGFGVALAGDLNLNTLGWFLYGTERVVLVGVVSLVLFVAMVAAICLSLVSSENYRTQEFYSQIRKPNALFVLRGFALALETPAVPEWVGWVILAAAAVGGAAGAAAGGGKDPEQPEPPRRGPDWKWWAKVVAGVVLAAGVVYLGYTYRAELANLLVNPAARAVGTTSEFLHRENYCNLLREVWSEIDTTSIIQEVSRKHGQIHSFAFGALLHETFDPNIVGDKYFASIVESVNNYADAGASAEDIRAVLTEHARSVLQSTARATVEKYYANLSKVK